MNNNATNSTVAESNKHMQEISVLKTNVLHSGTGVYTCAHHLATRLKMSQIFT
jgi:hypothetical protein